MSRCDAVVVGAGPAGGVAALMLALPTAGASLSGKTRALPLDPHPA